MFRVVDDDTNMSGGVNRMAEMPEATVASVGGIEKNLVGKPYKTICLFLFSMNVRTIGL
jgi:hypothetical protein